MLPRIDAQHGNHFRPTGAPRRSPLKPAVTMQLRAVIVLVHHIVVVPNHIAALIVKPPLGIEIRALPAPVRLRVRATGEVGRQNPKRVGARAVGVALADQPDEPGAEHGVGGVEHVALEGLDAAKGGDELLVEVFGHVLVGVFAAVGGDTLKVEVVVVGHGGVVEDGGVFCFAGGDEGDFFDGFVFEALACGEKGDVRYCVLSNGPQRGFASPCFLPVRVRENACCNAAKRTCDPLIQLPQTPLHIYIPSSSKPLLGVKIRYTLTEEFVGVGQRGDPVRLERSSLLLELGGGSGKSERRT